MTALRYSSLVVSALHRYPLAIAALLFGMFLATGTISLNGRSVFALDLLRVTIATLSMFGAGVFIGLKVAANETYEVKK